MPTTVKVPLKPGSDADATHRPTGTGYSHVDPPTLYLEKLAQQWMQARGDAKPGMSYILEGLPVGYALYQKPRIKQPSHVDKWLYGHPGNKVFDSPNRFFPHFQYLMDNEGSNIGCPCTVCNTKGGVLPPPALSRSSSARPNSKGSSRNATTLKRELHLAPAPAPEPTSKYSQPKGRPKMKSAGTDASRVDEEGTPDVYRNLIDKLKRYGTLDEAIMEPLSMDWRAEQAMLPDLLRTLEEEPQWAPRVGDVVLYINDIPDGWQLLQSTKTGQYIILEPDSKSFIYPAWRAGLVGQTPATSLDDEEVNVSLSGVRVEPLPNPNELNKSLSKRYKYAPVDHIRPFVLWKEYLDYIPEKDWHPTIKNALTTTATMSLVGKHRFRGQWPDAEIYCHGMYLGSEMLAVGDTVRLSPKSGETTITDILSIKSIRLKLANLDLASSNDYDEGRPYTSAVWIYGQAYTTNPSRSNKQWYLDPQTPRSADAYATWYPLHPVGKELAVPFSRILGRLIEHDVLQSWLPALANATNEDEALNCGREDLFEARSFSRANDRRILEATDATWFWADNRAEALDLETVNGIDISRVNAERDPAEMRKRIRIMEGASVSQNTQGNTDTASGVGRIRAFMAPGSAAATLPVRTTTTVKQEEEMGSSGVDDGSSGTGVEGESEVEIRRETRVVEEIPRSKKARVMVVID